MEKDFGNSRVEHDAWNETSRGRLGKKNGNERVVHIQRSVSLDHTTVLYQYSACIV
jgi:hypothetical protein